MAASLPELSGLLQDTRGVPRAMHYYHCDGNAHRSSCSDSVQHIGHHAMFTLYFAPHTCSLASHIALEDAAATYVMKRVDFAKTEQQKPDYLAINPKGRVPALVTPRGILTETPAMLVFIAQSFPKAQLAPLDDPFAFAELQAFNSYLCSTVHVAHAHRMRGYRWADAPEALEAMKKKVPQSVGACFELIEREMFRGPWAM